MVGRSKRCLGRACLQPAVCSSMPHCPGKRCWKKEDSVAVLGEQTYHLRSALVPFGVKLVFPQLKQQVLNVITGLKACSGAEHMIYKQRLHFQTVYNVLLALLNPFFA